LLCARWLSFSTTHEYCAQFCVRCVRGLFGCIECQPSFRDRSHLHTASYRCGSFLVFLANATISPYVTELTASSVLFVSAIFSFIYSVKQFVRYFACSSLCMRSRNGLFALMVSNIKNQKLVNKRISYQMAHLMPQKDS